MFINKKSISFTLYLIVADIQYWCLLNNVYSDVKLKWNSFHSENQSWESCLTPVILNQYVLFFGFHSTVTSLLDVTDLWLKNIDEGLVTRIVLIDLQKAFDNVHNLLVKLTSFGIGGVEHQWFQSYLSGWWQSISVDGHLSDPLPVSMWVAQGSILCHFLFLLFLNDLPSVAESCENNMFTDYSNIDTAEKPKCHEDVQNNLNGDLHKIKDYLKYYRGK